jgi:hypothetical protein
MKKKEKDQVLIALVSELRYFHNESKKTNKSYKFDLESWHVKETITLYKKLVNKWIRNCEVQESYIKYLDTIIKSLKKE